MVVPGRLATLQRRMSDGWRSCFLQRWGQKVKHSWPGRSEDNADERAPASNALYMPHDLSLSLPMIVGLIDHLKRDLLFVFDGIETLVGTEDGRALLGALAAARDAVKQRCETSGHFLLIGAAADETIPERLLVGGVEALPRLGSGRGVKHK